MKSGELNGILLGDSGYKLLPFLLTPYLTPNTPAVILFNKCHKSTRVRVEIAFGQLKRRFALMNFGLRLKIERCSGAILTACILHNLSKRFKDQIPDDNFDIEQNEDPEDILLFDESDSDLRAAGENARNEIAEGLVLL